MDMVASSLADVVSVWSAGIKITRTKDVEETLNFFFVSMVLILFPLLFKHVIEKHNRLRSPIQQSALQDSEDGFSMKLVTFFSKLYYT